MSDLIDRKAAIDVIDKIFPVDPMRNDYTQGITCGAALAMEFVKQLPPAEPKRGKWRHYEGVLTCMECGAEFYDDIMEYTGDEVPHFCPDCGANMEG